YLMTNVIEEVEHGFGNDPLVLDNQYLRHRQLPQLLLMHRNACMHSTESICRIYLVAAGAAVHPKDVDDLRREKPKDLQITRQFRGDWRESAKYRCGRNQFRISAVY